MNKLRNQEQRGRPFAFCSGGADFEPGLRIVQVNTLTEKEQLVLSLIGDGTDDQQAAAQFGLSPHTVNTHRKSIMAKPKLHHKGHLVRPFVATDDSGLTAASF